MAKRKRTRKEGQALQARITETIEKTEATDPSRTPAKLEAQLQLASKQIADLERQMSNPGAGYRSDLLVEEGAFRVWAPAAGLGDSLGGGHGSSEREPEAGIGRSPEVGAGELSAPESPPGGGQVRMHETARKPYEGLELIPRTDQDKWDTQHHMEMGHVSTNSSLVGSSIKTVEKRYGITLDVLSEERSKTLKPGVAVYVEGAASNVSKFFDDLHRWRRL